jgi:ArsR family transcriptional regulator
MSDGEQLSPEVVAYAVDLFRNLSHPVRFGLMWTLQSGDFCVKDLMEAMGASQVVTSQQLKRLRRCGLATSRQEKNRRIYSSTVRGFRELTSQLIRSSS